MKFDQPKKCVTQTRSPGHSIKLLIWWDFSISSICSTLLHGILQLSLSAEDKPWEVPHCGQFSQRIQQRCHITTEIMYCNRRQGYKWHSIIMSYLSINLFFLIFLYFFFNPVLVPLSWGVFIIEDVHTTLTVCSPETFGVGWRSQNVLKSSTPSENMSTPTPWGPAVT